MKKVQSVKVSDMLLNIFFGLRVKLATLGHIIRNWVAEATV